MNETIFYFFHNFAHQNIFLDKVFVFFAHTFPYIVVFLAVAFLIYRRAPWRVFAFTFTSAGLAWFAAKILKFFFNTDRPFVALADVNSLVAETGFAFPSGHSSFFMALAVSIFFYKKKIGWLFIAFAVIIGLSRIVIGVHFPIDILGGFVLGALIAYFLKNV